MVPATVVVLKDLPKADEPASDVGTTVVSVLKLTAVCASVGAVMYLETWATVSLARAVAVALGLSPELVKWGVVGVAVAQVVAYASSPWKLRRSGTYAAKTRAEGDALWKASAPLAALPTGFKTAGQALWWGLPGAFVFGPTMQRMSWTGKTLFNKDAVQMLEFRAVNGVPVGFKYGIPVVGSARCVASTLNGVESIAFAYRFLPIVDNLRRLDDETLIGRMQVGNINVLYFTLKEGRAKAK